MATRYVCILGDDVLRKRAKEVKKIDNKTLELLDDMANTLYEKDGVGLAAPQVGILKRIIIVDVGDGLIELINPVIIKQEGTQMYMEGCLSYPGYFGNVERPEKVTLRGQNREGHEVEHVAEGLLAVAFCHEVDHLDGKMFIDRVVGRIYSAEQLREMKADEEALDMEQSGQEGETANLAESEQPGEMAEIMEREQVGKRADMVEREL